MILVVEDEELVADMVRLNLEHAGLIVEVCGTAEAAVTYIDQAELIVLDRMLPGMDGLEFARLVRQRRRDVPILMLTARSEVAARVAGLDAGADDYLAKPFAMPELLARVRALLRRAPASAPAPPPVEPAAVRKPTGRVLRFDRYSVNLDTREAVTNDGPEILTETECQLMTYVHAHPGELLTRTDILENVWGMDRFPTARTVDNYVLRLRKLFEPDPENPKYLLTVRGRGYCLRLPAPPDS